MRRNKKRAIQMTLVDANNTAEPTAPEIDVDEVISAMEKSTTHVLITGALATAGLFVVKTVCKIAESNFSK